MADLKLVTLGIIASLIGVIILKPILPFRGTFTITAALSDLEIYAILGNIAASFGGGGPTVTVDGSAITGPPAYPEMDADQLGAAMGDPDARAAARAYLASRAKR